MKFCCDDFKDVFDMGFIQVRVFELGDEYFLILRDDLRVFKLNYCPFCGVDLD